MRASAATGWDEVDEQPRGWLGQAARRTLGVALVALGLIVATALWGFSPADPTWNHATSAQVQNPLGAFGASLADLLLQCLGIAAWLLPVIAIARGLREALGRPLAWPWLPFVALPLALLALAAFLGSLHAPPRVDWPFRVGLGGYVGDFLLNRMVPQLGTGLYGLLAGIAALVLSIAALGVRASESRSAIHHAANTSRWLSRQVGPAMLAARRVSVGAMRGSERGEDAPQELQPRRGIAGALARMFGRGREEEAPRFRPRTAAVAPDLIDSARPAAKPKRPKRTSATTPLLVDEPEELDHDESAFASFENELIPEPPAGNYALPKLDLLMVPRGQIDLGLSKPVLNEISRQLEAVLDDFGVKGQILDAKPGPVVTLFELEPAPGTRSQRVIGLADDIARSLSARSVRVATVPGRNVIGIELPNDQRETVYLRDLLESDTYRKSGARLAMALGKDISGNSIVVDLARMPHLLIAGTTGSGKSVAINAMILSLLYRLTPDECRIIMIDPKVIELSVYEDIPHLLAPVVTEPHKAVVALKWVVRQMDERYRLMSHLGVRDIFAFNRRIQQAQASGEELKRRVRVGFEPGSGLPIMEDQEIASKPLPLIVVIVDEVADLMLTAGKEIEHCIQRLSQKARAAGVHLIVATQRPSVDVLTGVIKANLPSRISFRVSSKIDSRTILGEMGAEQLLGQGDMLYLMPGDRISRIHGPLVTDGEVEKVVRHWKAQGHPDYDDEVTSENGGDGPSGDTDSAMSYGSGGDGEGDRTYRQAVDVVARDGKASTSYLQRKLGIGYNSAAKLIERMEDDGLITRADHVGRRQVLMGRGGIDGNEPTDL